MAVLVLSALAGIGFFILLQLVAPLLWNLPWWKLPFHARPFHAVVDQYPEDHQPGAAPVQFCLHLCKPGGWRNVLFGGWGWSWKGSLSEESDPFPKFLARQPALEKWLSIGKMLVCHCSAGVFSYSGKRGTLHPFSQSFKLCFLPPLIPLPHPIQPYAPWKCGIGRSLSAETSQHRLAICLCFISPTKRWARMRDLCVLPSSFFTSTRIEKLV